MTTATYSEIKRTTDKAVCLTIDGFDVWLPKTGIFVDPINKNVSHTYLEDSIAEAKSDTELVDLGPIVWTNAAGTSEAYDVTLTLIEGDPELSTTRIRVFVPSQIGHAAGVPTRFIADAIKRQVPHITNLEYQVFNLNDDVVYSSPVKLEF